MVGCRTLAQEGPFVVIAVGGWLTTPIQPNWRQVGELVIVIITGGLGGEAGARGTGRGLGHADARMHALQQQRSGKNPILPSCGLRSDKAGA